MLAHTRCFFFYLNNRLFKLNLPLNTGEGLKTKCDSHLPINKLCMTQQSVAGNGALKAQRNAAIEEG